MNKSKMMLVLLIIILIIVGIIMLRNNDAQNVKTTDVVDEEKTKIVLYFSNPANGELTKEYRYVNIDNIKDDMPTTIINELLKGPENTELNTAIPSETKVNSVLVEENKIIIDFSKEFVENSGDEIKDLHKIYSVVNSLTEITEINEVEIKVNGEKLTSKVRL